MLARQIPNRTEARADLEHSGNQRLLAGEGDQVRRQALLDTCTRRAQGNAAFASALDGLLSQETPVSVRDSAAQIIGNANSPLHESPSMQELLTLSTHSPDGSLTVSSNRLNELVSAEMETFHQIVNTNLALRLETVSRQEDLLSYLTNQAAIDANTQREADVKRGQDRRIASATAAISIQSGIATSEPSVPEWGNTALTIAGGLNDIIGGDFVGGGLSIAGLFTDAPLTDDAVMAREIEHVKTLIGDLSTNMNYRFDRVDQSLTTLYNTLNTEFDNIHIEFDLQGRRIARLDGKVDDVRYALLKAQTAFSRLERNLATFHALDWRSDLRDQMNLGLDYDATASTPLAYDLYNPNYVVMATTFYTYAYDRATQETLSRWTTLPFSEADFYSQLSADAGTNVYAETLNYIKKCLRVRLLVAGFPEEPTLANPQDWSAGAGAFLQLALEHPGYFRKYDRDRGYQKHLEEIIGNGQNLTDFFRKLVFTGSGTNINWPLYTPLTNYYADKLTSFLTRVEATEQDYATNSANGFALNTWRQWDIAAPRVTATATEVLAAPTPPPPIPRDAATRIAAGYNHGLALKADGTLLAWGQNDCGQTDVPAGLTNVAAIAAGASHSLALKSDGTVVGWGPPWVGLPGRFRGECPGTAICPARRQFMPPIPARRMENI